MILIKSLAVLLLIFILAHFGKKFFGQSTEGFGTEGFGTEGFGTEELGAKELGAKELGEDAIEAGASALPGASASQKAQKKAQQLESDDSAVADHRAISNDSMDMERIKSQVSELVQLSKEAKAIDESFKSFAD